MVLGDQEPDRIHEAVAGRHLGIGPDLEREGCNPMGRAGLVPFPGLAQESRKTSGSDPEDGGAGLDPDLGEAGAAVSDVGALAV